MNQRIFYRFKGQGGFAFKRSSFLNYLTPKRLLTSNSKNNKPENGGSIFRKFAESVKNETKDEDLKASVKKFEEKLTEFRENESVKKAKEILSKAKDDVLKQNEAIVKDVKEKTETIKNAVGTVSNKVGETISTATKPIRQIGEKISPYVPDISESEVVKKVGKTVGEAEEKILENTNIYRYGGFKSKDLREKTRSRLINEGENSKVENTTEAVEANPEYILFRPGSCLNQIFSAGSSIVMHKESKWASKWNDFVDNSRVLNKFFGMKRAYDESNNIFVYFVREITNSISDRFASVFSENETARAMREIQLRDSSFNLEKFMKFANEHIIPEILDAFLAADLPTLRVWCSESMYNMLKANFDAQLKPGCMLEGRILDLRHLELVTAKLLDDTPVIVFSFNTQQISLLRDKMTNKIVEGSEHNIENVLYVMALAKEELPVTGKVNPTTQGWKLVELAIRDKNGSW